MINGIDVSNFQGNIDWGLVSSAGIQFAFAKATESTYYRDPYFPTNWSGMKDNGLIRGAYHFAQPDNTSPEDQAAYFLDYIGDLSPTDLLALDLEAGTGDLGDWTQGFLSSIESQVGFKPLLYSGYYFLKDHGCFWRQDLSQYGLWLAAYQSSFPETPPSWPFIAIWQNSDSGRFDGVNGNVDTDIFNGDMEGLLAYGMPLEVVEPVVCA